MKMAFLLTILLITTAGFSQTINKGKMDSLFQILSVQNKGMGSVAIFKNGQEVYTNAIGYAQITPNEKILSTRSTKYRIGSISKMFTGVIIFRLIEDNKLSLDDKLVKFYPAIPNAEKISIGMLLSHRSGIHNFTDDSLYSTYYRNNMSQQDMLNIIAKAKPDFEPGSKAAYSNSNFVLLGYIAEKISKRSYKDLVDQYITSKLNLRDTYVGGKTNIKNEESYSYHFFGGWEQDPETDMSVPGGAGSIVSTPTDLSKFIHSLFNGKLIDSVSLHSMMTIKDGLGMAIFQFPFYEKKAWGHGGTIDGFNAMLGYFPEDSLAVAYCSNGQVYPINDIMIGILSIYFNKPYEIPTFKHESFTVSDLDKYPGVYSNTQLAMKIAITMDNKSLIAQGTGQPSFPLEATEKDIFKYEPAGVVIEFHPAKSEFILKQGGSSFLFKKDK